MQNINATVSAILSHKMGTDAGYVRRVLEAGGETLASIIAAFATPEQIRAMNQKACKRFVEACDFALSGDRLGKNNRLNKTTAYLVAVIALAQQQRVSFADAHRVCGLFTEDGRYIKGVDRPRVARFIGGRAGSAGTITSQVSRTVGQGREGCGFFTALGISRKGDKHGFELTETAKSHPLILAYCAQLERISDGDFELLMRDDTDK